MKIISKTNLTNEQLTQLLAYDYEEYRMEEESVIIKVVNGPHIELYSKHRIETGEHDPAKEDHLDHPHDHVSPADRKMKKLQIRTVNVFGESE